MLHFVDPFCTSSAPQECGLVIDLFIGDVVGMASSDGVVL